MQVALHQHFELVALFAFSDAFGAILVENAGECGLIGASEIYLRFILYQVFRTRHITQAKTARRIEPFRFGPQFELYDVDPVLAIKHVHVTSQHFADDLAAPVGLAEQLAGLFAGCIELVAGGFLF